MFSILESAQWESSLTTENVLQMDCVQQLVKKIQVLKILTLIRAFIFLFSSY